MLYLGTASTVEVREQMASGRLGQMRQPTCGHVVVPGTLWAADNGCFAETWTAEHWWAWLERQPRTALFATAPDVVGDAPATLDRFAEWGPRIRALGFRVALVGQNFVQDLDIPWDDLDCWFAGGLPECRRCRYTVIPTPHVTPHCTSCGRRMHEWKLSHAAGELAREARARGKWCHLGRVNSSRRYRAWVDFYDSCDGTYLARGPDTNLPKLLGWLDRHEQTPQLWPDR